MLQVVGSGDWLNRCVANSDRNSRFGNVPKTKVLPFYCGSAAVCLLSSMLKRHPNNQTVVVVAGRPSLKVAHYLCIVSVDMWCQTITTNFAIAKEELIITVTGGHCKLFKHIVDAKRQSKQS